jgi:hypothetical protein
MFVTHLEAEKQHLFITVVGARFVGARKHARTLIIIVLPLSASENVCTISKSSASVSPPATAM